MSLPAVMAIRAKFAGSQLAVAAPRALAPLYGIVPEVDEVVPLDSGRTQAAMLAQGRFDLAILLPNSFSSAYAAYRAGIPERWGYATDLRSRLLTRGVRRPRHRDAGARHHSYHYQQLVQGLDIQPAPLDVRLDVPESGRQLARDLLRRERSDDAGPLLGIAPGAAYGHAKRWTPEHVADLILALFQQHDVVTVLFGSAGDRDSGRAVESSLARRAARAGASPRVLNLIGKTDLTSLMGLIAECRAFVSNDSGAMHLAAALGVRVTAIFGPTDEAATSPLGPHEIVMQPVWCRPCLLRECPIDHRCMTGVQAERVMASVVRGLGPLDPPGLQD